MKKTSKVSMPKSVNTKKSTNNKTDSFATSTATQAGVSLTYQTTRP